MMLWRSKADRRILAAAVAMVVVAAAVLLYTNPNRGEANLRGLLEGTAHA